MSISLVEDIVKSKVFGLFLIFWGATFFFMALSDFAYYSVNFGAPNFTETLVESATWIIYDIMLIGAAATLWVIAVKVLQARK